MIIIYKEEKNGKFEFTKKELENILEQARKEGYDEGYKDGIRTYTTITTSPIITNTPKIDWTKWTCSGVSFDEEEK